MASQLNRGLLSLLATGGALSAMSPDEAEAKVSPHFLRPYIDAWHNNLEGTMHAGTFEPEIFNKIKQIYPNAKNNVYASLHAGDSRAGRDGWSMERVGGAFEEMLDAPHGDIVKNWEKNIKKRSPAMYGVMIPYKDEPKFSPFLIDEQGNIVLKTIFPPNEARMEKLGYGVEGGKPFISRGSDDLDRFSPVSSGHMSKAGTQPQPVSVVIPQPNLGNTLADFFDFSKVKVDKGIGTAVGAGTGTLLWPTKTAAFVPEQAQASIPAKPHRYPADEPGWVNPEPPLGTPVFDPADVITGGVGIAGTGAKLLASAMTPFVNYGVDKITNGIFSLFQDTPNRNGGGGV